MGEADYDSVCKDMRLTDGSLWPIPITLDVNDAFVGGLKKGERIALRDKEGFALAILTISDIWQPDLRKEAGAVYGTTDETHPAVNYLFNRGHKNYIGGSLKGISLPHHYDYQKDRHTPEELRTIFAEKGWKKIVAFQTRNPLHCAHVEMTMQDRETIETVNPFMGHMMHRSCSRNIRKRSELRWCHLNLWCICLQKIATKSLMKWKKAQNFKPSPERNCDSCLMKEKESLDGSLTGK